MFVSDSGIFILNTFKISFCSAGVKSDKVVTWVYKPTLLIGSVLLKGRQYNKIPLSAMATKQAINNLNLRLSISNLHHITAIYYWLYKKETNKTCDSLLKKAGISVDLRVAHLNELFESFICLTGVDKLRGKLYAVRH